MSKARRREGAVQTPSDRSSETARLLRRPWSGRWAFPELANGREASVNERLTRRGDDERPWRGGTASERKSRVEEGA